MSVVLYLVCSEVCKVADVRACGGFLCDLACGEMGKFLSGEGEKVAGPSAQDGVIAGYRGGRV